MNKRIICFFVLLLISLSFGIVIGHEKLIPDFLINNFNMNKSTSNQDISYDSNFENNVLDLIDIDDPNDIVKLRSNLINYIWHESSLPYLKQPANSDTNIFDNRYDDLENLKQIDKFLISMEYGVNSTSYLFLAEESNNNLIIYHQGHKGDFYNGKTTIQYFLKNGYSVLAFSMPLLGMNNQPTVNSEFGQINLVSHNYFSFIESPQFSPMKFYFEPIVLALNSIDNNFDFDNYYMIGLSGGGWTTTVYSAIDERISQSFSIAGSIPIFLRTHENNLGDYEQISPNFYKIANYLELYLLASHGEDRKHIQIFNKNDPCCFSGDPRGIFDDKINSILKDLDSDSYEIYVDDTHSEHKISEYSLNIIKNKIEKIS